MVSISTSTESLTDGHVRPVASVAGEPDRTSMPAGQTSDRDGANAAGFDNTAAERPPLIDVKEFAAKLGCCPKHIRRMADSGRCPPPIHLGALQRWNRQVVDDWIAAGCPVVRQVRISGRK